MSFAAHLSHSRSLVHQLQPVRGAAPLRDAVQLLDRGLPIAFDRAQASALLREDPAIVHIDLGLGTDSSVLWTCDLSAEYIRINADYTT